MDGVSQNPYVGWSPHTGSSGDEFPEEMGGLFPRQEGVGPAGCPNTPLKPPSLLGWNSFA